jgi:glycosyltransferase involved in cell wall biosynthesis
VSAPLVTIALPVYNGEQFLTSAVESLLAQTMGDFELIVCDNASTDATEDMVRDWMRRDSRIRYIPSPVNRGLAWNWNRAVPEARGRYFKWAAADDVHLPDYLRRTVEVLDTDPTAVLAHCRTVDIDEDGVLIEPVPGRAGMDAATPHERFRAMSRRSWKSVQVFGLTRLPQLRRTGLHGAYPSSDLVLLAELGLQGRLVEIDEVLFHRREYSGRVTRMTTPAARYPFFTGQPAPAAPMPHWDLLRGFVTAVARAPLPPPEKARCLMELRDFVGGHYRRMVREVQWRVLPGTRPAEERQAPSTRPPSPGPHADGPSPSR